MKKDYVEEMSDMFGNLVKFFLLKDPISKEKEKYKCRCLMHCRDVLRINDPDKITEEQFKEIVRMGVDAFLIEEVTRDFCASQHTRILEMRLTTLPVTDYIVKKLKEKHLE